MKAAVRDVYGPPSVVRIEEVDKPSPARDQVLVRVHAASVNRADLDGLYPRWQFTRMFLGLRRPRFRGIGADLAGVVESVGPAVTRFKAGDAVFGELLGLGQGSMAEYVCVREKALTVIPSGMPFEVAGALSHSGVLALQGLRLRNGRTIGPGKHVLIDGASGNVGPYAVQIAKSMGAEVTGTASSAKLDFVRSLGADHAIDYTAVDYTRTGAKYDWILDVDARRSILRCRRALKPDGVYVALGGSGAWLLQSLLLSPLVFFGRKRSGLMLWWQPAKPEDVARLLELIATGQVTPIIDRTFPLAQAADALAYVDEGRARGKVVVTMA